MAPKYKLTYFALKGLGEPIRFMLCYIEADWEDIRINVEQWPTFKDSKYNPTSIKGIETVYTLSITLLFNTIR